MLSAVNIRDNLFPLAELQVVAPLRVAKIINGAERKEAENEFECLEVCASGLTSYLTGAPYMNFYYAEDLPTDEFTQEVARVIELDDATQKHFASKKHTKQHYAAYIAAHLLLHDAPGDLREVNTNVALEAKPKRIISVGAQSERAFYVARAACRKAGVLPDTAVKATGQLFTKHVLPPYLPCREGEPHVLDIETLQEETIHHPVASVQRDLRFLHQRIGAPQKERIYET